MLLGSIAAAAAQPGTSAFTSKLDDPRAIPLTGAAGDGKADDSAAIQAAIDKAASDRGEGIVFIPQGRYRLTRTIYVWPSVRVIGWGARRPVFVLGDNTPGFSKRHCRHGVLCRRTAQSSSPRTACVPRALCRARHRAAKSRHA